MPESLRFGIPANAKRDHQCENVRFNNTVAVLELLPAQMKLTAMQTLLRDLNAGLRNRPFFVSEEVVVRCVAKAREVCTTAMPPASGTGG